MTQEEKAKAYDKAIEKIKYVMEHGVSPTLNKEDLEDIFPELRESEDERIRKELIEHIKANCESDFILFQKFSSDDVIAWLEKQGDKPQVDGFDAELNALLKKYEYLPKEELAECLSFYLGAVQGEQKPKWSDEDERIMNFCISRIQDELEALRNNKFAHQEILQDLKEGCWERIDWLKSIKQRMV